MNVHDWADLCCKEPTFIDALAMMALFECERAMGQANRARETGINTGSHGGMYDTCFKRCFEVLTDR